MDAFSSMKYKSMNGEQQQYNQQYNDDSIAMTESVILGPYDVICGRGKLSFNNIGNRRFRIIIGMNVGKYNDINSRHCKGLFIRSLVDDFVNEIGAKFYKMNRNNTKLIELTRTQRREKIGHALRDVVAFQESQQKLQREIMSKVETTTTTTTITTKQKSLLLSSTDESIWNYPLSNLAMNDVNFTTDAAYNDEIISSKLQQRGNDKTVRGNELDIEHWDSILRI